MHNPMPIKVAMVKQGLDGRRLAIKARVSHPTVSKILHGKQVLPSKLEAVLKALDLSFSDVYETREEPELATTGA